MCRRGLTGLSRSRVRLGPQALADLGRGTFCSQHTWAKVTSPPFPSTAVPREGAGGEIEVGYVDGYPELGSNLSNELLFGENSWDS